MGEDHIFEQRWDFRSKDSDLDSSSNNSRTNTRAVPKNNKKKQKVLVPGYVSEENEEPSQQHPSSKERNLNQPPKSKGKAKRSKKTAAFNYDSSAALYSLQTFMGSLVHEIKVAKQGLFVWMGEEMGKLVADNSPPQPKPKPKPTRRRKSSGHGHGHGQEEKQQQSKRRGEPGGGTRTQNQSARTRTRTDKKSVPVDGNSNSDQVAEKQASHMEAVGSLASSTSAALTTTAIPSTTSITSATLCFAQQERVSIPSGMSICKPKFSIDPSDHKASCSNYLSTVPTNAIFPRQNNPSSYTNTNIKPVADFPANFKPPLAAAAASVNKRVLGGEAVSKSSVMDLSTNVTTYFGGLHQADKFLAKKGPSSTGGSNGSGFPAQLYQGLNGGFGILNSNHLRLDLDHLTQTNGISNPNVSMNNGRGCMRFSGGGHDFTGHQNRQ
ncbi:hypothetical protein Dimus_030976 [Dionaea muscipula]